MLLDNVRSSFNVGSIFRIADGVGARHIHLCGITPTPDNGKVAKTALGAENSVSWSYDSNALNIAEKLHVAGFTLWAIENNVGSELITRYHLPPSGKVALIVGSEVTGVDPDLLARSERILHIPMDGVKGSLNVAVAFGIAVYWLRAAAR